MDIRKVAVIGGGTMGNGIAHVFAMSGYPVTLIETRQEFADRALATIDRNLERMVNKEKITADKKIRNAGEYLGEPGSECRSERRRPHC